MTVVPRPAKGRPARAATHAVSRRGAKAGGLETVRFGDVTVTAPRPSEAEIKRNVEESTRALKRALPRLVRPGVRIYAKKDVPLYWADPDSPDGFIRKLNGRLERGVLDEDGTFKAID